MSSDETTPLLNGDRDALGEYVRRLADLMALRDWSFVVEPDPPPEDARASAEITCVYGQKRGMIRFDTGWETWTPEKLRMISAHELIHAHLDSIRLPITNIRNVLGQPLYDATCEANKDAIEYATDAIATAWAATLPLPVKADEEEAA